MEMAHGISATHAERVHAQPAVHTITMKDLKLALANGLDALLPGASRLTPSFDPRVSYFAIPDVAPAQSAHPGRGVP
jgi:hypothetical protein